MVECLVFMKNKLLATEFLGNISTNSYTVLSIISKLMIEARKEVKDQAYIIKEVPEYINIDAESPPMNPQMVQQNADKSYISKCLARLKRYRKFPPDVETGSALAALIQQVLPVSPTVHFFNKDYFVIQTVKTFSIFKWDTDTQSSLRIEKQGEEFRFSEQIKCLDIIKTLDGELKIAVVTLSSNNIYSLYIFFDNAKIHQFDLNEKICGVRFIKTEDFLVLVLNLEREIIVYTEDEDKKFQPQRPFRKEVDKQQIGGADFDKIKGAGKKVKQVMPIQQRNIIAARMLSHQNKIYSAYLVDGKEDSKGGHQNLLLDEMTINPVTKAVTGYRQYILERYTKGKQQQLVDNNQSYQIKDMMIIDGNPGEVSILLALMKEVLLIRLSAARLPKIQCPYEWSYDQDHFMLNPKLLSKPSELDQLEDKEISCISTKAEDFLLMIKYCNFVSTTQKPQFDRQDQYDLNSNPDVGKLVLLNIRSYCDKIKQRFETSHIKDIISVPTLKQSGSRQLIRCSIYQDKMVFFFFNLSESNSHCVQIFYTIAISPEDKIDQLLPDKIRIEGRRSQGMKEDHVTQFKPPQQFIPKEDLKMLLILNDTYQKDSTGNKLYKCVWAKVKGLLKQERNNSRSLDSEMEALQSYATFLYKVNDFTYVDQQIKNIIKECGIKKSFLKKYYIAVKKIAKEKIQAGELDKNFKKYLKSTFFLKKLYLFPSTDTIITQKNYKNWKSKDITKELLNEVKSRNKNAVKEIINLFKSYFIENYEKIIHDIFQQETTKGIGMQGSIIECKEILQVLLPHFPLNQTAAKKEKDKEEDPRHLAFEVAGELEQTCFDDLKLNISKNAELMQFKKAMAVKYMRNNDFLFKQRKQLTQKQERLVAGCDAIFTFLSQINLRGSSFPSSAQSAQNLTQSPSASILDSEPIPAEEQFLKLLVKNSFIDKTVYLDLFFYVRLFKLYKKDIDETMPMKQFLSTPLSQIFYNIIFGCSDHDQVQQKIEFLLTKAMLEWDPIFKALQDQAVDLVTSEIEDTPYNQPVFQTFVQLCFDTAQNKGKSAVEILEKCKVFLEVIGKMQKNGAETYQFVIEKIMKTIFKYLRTSQFKLAQQIKDLTEQIRINPNAPAEHCKSTLEIFCNNFDFFKTFGIDTVFTNLQSQEIYSPNIEEQQYCEIKDVVIVEILESYIQKKMQKPVRRQTKSFNRSVSFNEQTFGIKGDQIMTPMPMPHSYGDISENKPTFENFTEVPTFRGLFSGEGSDGNWIVTFKRQEEQKNGTHLVELTFNFNKPENMLQLLFVFTEEFFKNVTIHWKERIFTIFLDVLLDFQLKKPEELNLLEDLESAVRSSEIDLSDEDRKFIFYERLKQKIEETKRAESQSAPNQELPKLIGQCLQILQTCDKMKTYVRQEQLVLKLKNAKYEIADIPALRDEKDSIVNEIQCKERQGEISRSVAGKAYGQAKENESVLVLNELFQSSTKKKCDDYIDQCLKNPAADLVKAITDLKKAEDLFQPLYLILKLMETKNNLKGSINQLVDQPSSPTKQSKGDKVSTTSLKTKKMIAQVSDEFNSDKKAEQNLVQLKCNLIRSFIVGKADVEEFIDRHWEQIIATKTDKKEVIDKSHVRCDIEMFYYVPEFLEIKYYTYVQLLYNDYARGARLLVRYRKKLNYDIQKVMQLTRIFIKRNKQQIVNRLIITMQMLANVLKGSVEVFSQYDVHYIKKEILGTQKPKDKDEAKAYERLQSVYDVYTYYDRNVPSQQKTSNPVNDITVPLDNKRPFETHSNSRTNEHLRTDHREQARFKGERFIKEAKRLFNQGRYAQFIEVVEYSKESVIASEPDYNADEFNMYFFRLFASCIKFDEKLGKIFPFEFFLEKNLEYKTHTAEKISRNSKLRDIFEKHLRKTIREFICEENYIQIAKAVRFGFYNFAELQLKIILIYLEKTISERRADMEMRKKGREKDYYNQVQQEADLQRSIKLVIDNVDLSDLTPENRELFTNTGVEQSQYNALMSR